MGKKTPAIRDAAYGQHAGGGPSHGHRQHAQKLVKIALVVPEAPLHDTTGCQSGLTTGCIVYTNIQPVVKPV